jgi:hypothetical protein
VKGVSSGELVRQGFWNGVGNLVLGAAVFAAVAALAFLIPQPKTVQSKSKTASCGCSL